jgi:hypothetical protein
MIDARQALLREALFGSVRRVHRRFLEQKWIVTVDDLGTPVDISYTGQELDALDLATWDSLISGNLEASGASKREAVRESLSRLAACCVRFRFLGSGEFRCSFIRSITEDEVSGYLRVELDPFMRDLMHCDEHTAWNVTAKREWDRRLGSMPARTSVPRR